MGSRRWARWGVLACFGLGCVACVVGCAAERAAAPESSTAPRALEEPEPTTIEEAEAQLARARAALAGTAATAPTAPSATAAPSGAAGGAAGETVQSQGLKSETMADHPAPNSACATGCRAVASMRRAVDAICRIAGATDARCSDARRTLGDSEAKLGACGC